MDSFSVSTLDHAAERFTADPCHYSSKARGLIELRQLRLPTPEALFIKRLNSSQRGDENWRKLSSAVFERGLDAIEDATSRRIGDLACRFPLLFCIRCESKRIHPALPQSLLNLGITGRCSSTFHRSLLRDRDWQIERAAQQTAWDMRTIDRLRRASGREQVILAIFLMANAVSELSLPDSSSTLIVQRMCFGNASADSASGMAYTRHPRKGNVEDYGRFKFAASGARFALAEDKLDISELRSRQPQEYQQLRRMLDRLEGGLGGVRYVEWVLQDGEVFFVQNGRGRSEPGLSWQRSRVENS